MRLGLWLGLGLGLELELILGYELWLRLGSGLGLELILGLGLWLRLRLGSGLGFSINYILYYIFYIIAIWYYFYFLPFSAPPSYEECFGGRSNIKEETDNDFTKGEMEFAPRYTYYDLSQQPQISSQPRFS